MRRFIGIATIAALAAVALSFNAYSHSGGVDAQGCHMDKAVGAKHCHYALPDSSKIKVSPEARDLIDQGAAELAKRGQLIQDLERDVAALVDRDEANRRDIGTLQDEVKQERARANAAVGRIEEADRRAAVAEAHYAGLVDAAAVDRRTAAELKSEAQSVLAQAEARERGAGPKSSRDCRTAITSHILDAETTWAGNLKVEKEDLRAVRGACLE